MKYEELGPALRTRVDAAIGAPAKQRTGKGGGSTSGGGASWRCSTCGEVFTTWASVKRHPHLRVECVLTCASNPQPSETP